MGELIAVTGGTGLLGRTVVARLAEMGTPVRLLSRRPKPTSSPGVQWATVDLDTGGGLDAALAGASGIVHCATAMRGARDAVHAQTLAAAARRAGCPHVVYVSIVGIDRIALSYYRDKLAAEDVFARSGLPYTILRATQFHDLVREMLAAAATMPLMLVPGCSFQPVDVRDVAERLVELAMGEPAGRAADMGGPQVLSARELARTYLEITGRRRLVATVRVPGRVGRGLRAGANLVPEQRAGAITFEAYLAACRKPGGLSYRGQLS
ncbi:SDR family oxidoreductase [Mycobacterium conspicuum]|jgi:uncharacterized protein YbjT (DUF2867 family)|uniref:Nucleotide-diphosphate-sugar epimerase n=1 Tax=Mycobacterium conspicuum TaxID=44010 RepID=A0A1X1T7E1_9MYCO|nr:SDR family oxidoreductase [Mycobacterium conspicuum]ORV40494.1 hypothetical protein AWC00_00385 [Mycobacterium conspicuum]BBZ40521.1 nucleotide-diphosphate-sugar epimerase [Mycobacterium conspicuum]